MTRVLERTAFADFLARNDRESIRVALTAIHPADAAAILAGMPAEQAARALSALADRKAAEILGFLELDRQGELVAALGRADLVRIVSAMAHDERADLFNRLSEAERATLLPALAAAEREDIRKLASYPEGTAGSIMTSDYAALGPELSVGEAIAKLRKEAPDKETIYDAYVVDEGRRLVGVVSLRDLLLASDDARVGDIMRREVIFARVEDPRELVAQKIAEYDLLALPIVDGGAMLVGIVTVDDAMDVAERAQARRLVRFGGTTTLGGPDLDILRSRFRELFGQRFFWLALLTLFGILTSHVVAAQSAVLEEIVILAAFMAPIIDMGGNTGSQSATLVIRAMALGQVQTLWRDFFLVLRRDLLVALALGLAVAALEVALAFLTKDVSPEVLLVVGLAMLVVTAAGSLIGLALPFAARLVKADPATLSAPVITSIMDLLGVLIYFGLAWLFLGDLLRAG
ncbi:MAG: magnesium transporter [Geminicoccaceae bacterium]|nr:magnesium transporter [Geminicoccaceae bacterium]MCX8099668.1 magnesium transporter [Geminicoccaceae bacterium]MDW8370905.1 magnesium transporter [Geminicoccaceae bacterium]